MARILLTTIGSYGDLLPLLALAQALQARGHQPVLATTPIYHDQVVATGVEFAPMRPDQADFGDYATTMRRSNDLRTGSEFVVRQLVMPFLRQSYQDLMAASTGADLILTQTLAFAGRLVAEKLGLPWVGLALAPFAMASHTDPPVFAQAPWLNSVHQVSPWAYNQFLNMVRRSISTWSQPLHELRQELGLPPMIGEPMLEGAFSPYLNLALFSPLLATPQPDWPPNTHVTGFVFFDQDPSHAPTDTAAAEQQATTLARIDGFIAQQGKPIVFALGTTAVHDAGNFYAESIQAARAVEHPAIIITGRDPANIPTELLGADTLALDYLPYREVFAKAEVTVHQGGIGTLAQALRAGKPTLVVPFSHDQPDNAARAVRLGVAATLPRRRYTCDNAAKALRPLLDDTTICHQAATVGAQIRAEDGAAAACDALETLLAQQA